MEQWSPLYTPETASQLGGYATSAVNTNETARVDLRNTFYPPETATDLVPYGTPLAKFCCPFTECKRRLPAQGMYEHFRQAHNVPLLTGTEFDAHLPAGGGKQRVRGAHKS
ncbi:hypothetical protein MTO96_036358 [Rhipicephalus appendiculatus]